MLLSIRNIIVHLVVWLKSINHNMAIYIVLRWSIRRSYPDKQLFTFLQWCNTECKYKIQFLLPTRNNLVSSCILKDLLHQFFGMEIRLQLQGTQKPSWRRCKYIYIIVFCRRYVAEKLMYTSSFLNTTYFTMQKRLRFALYMLKSITTNLVPISIHLPLFSSRMMARDSFFW